MVMQLIGSLAPIYITVDHGWFTKTNTLVGKLGGKNPWGSRSEEEQYIPWSSEVDALIPIPQGDKMQSFEDWIMVLT